MTQWQTLRDEAANARYPQHKTNSYAMLAYCAFTEGYSAAMSLMLERERVLREALNEIAMWPHNDNGPWRIARDALEKWG